MTEHTADLRREEIARTPEQALADSIEGQNLYHGRYGTVPAGRTTALAILSGLRHDGFDLVRSQDTATARIAALEGALVGLAEAAGFYAVYVKPIGEDVGGPSLSEAVEQARAVLSGETRTGGETVE